MSAAGRGQDRQPFDGYSTPTWAVRRLLEAIHLPDGNWLEPCAGEGRLVRGVEQVRPGRQTWYLNEIQETLAVLTANDLGDDFGKPVHVWHGDFLADELPPGLTNDANGKQRRFSVAITNPPFVHAMEFRDRMRRMADYAVMLLRLPWMASAKRHQSFVEDPPAIVAVLPNRPSFTPDGKTDATDYCWAVWAPRGWGGRTRMIWLDETPIVERREG